MKIKLNIGWVKIGGVLLALSLIAPIGAQARPQWDYCVDRMNSRGDMTPRYNHSRHMMDDGDDTCWGHGRGHHHDYDKD